MYKKNLFYFNQFPRLEILKMKAKKKNNKSIKNNKNDIEIFKK